MTISKKILLAATLSLGVLCGISAYDAIALKSEVTNVLNFAEKIKQTPIAANKRVAKWLSKGLTNKWTKHSFFDANVIDIARIVENESINTEVKIAQLLEIIVREKTASEKDAQKTVTRLTVARLSKIEPIKKTTIEQECERETENALERKQHQIDLLKWFAQTMAIGVAALPAACFLSTVGECLGNHVGSLLVRKFFTA